MAHRGVSHEFCAKSSADGFADSNCRRDVGTGSEDRLSSPTTARGLKAGVQEKHHDDVILCLDCVCVLMMLLSEGSRH